MNTVAELKEECASLCEKLDALNAFVTGNTEEFKSLPEIQQKMMQLQLSAMKAYRDALKNRISIMPEDEAEDEEE